MREAVDKLAAAAVRPALPPQLMRIRSIAALVTVIRQPIVKSTLAASTLCARSHFYYDDLIWR